MQEVHYRTQKQNKFFYEIATQINNHIEQKNKKEQTDYKLYILIEPYFDILGKITTEKSGSVKSIKFATKDTQLEDSFNIIAKPIEDTVFFLFDLDGGIHDILTLEKIKQKHKIELNNIEKPHKNMMGLIFQSYPKNKMIHAIYKDFNGNNTIITYILYKCNCIQREQATTDISSYMLIALKDSDISDKTELRKIYSALTNKIVDNQQFPYQRIGDHEIIRGKEVLTEQYTPENWKVAELESLETFRKVIIEERKSLIKFLQEIGE